MATMEKKLNIKPFRTPNFVVLEVLGAPQRDIPAIPLRDIHKDTLLEMCRDFTKEILLKAGYTYEEGDLK